MGKWIHRLEAFNSVDRTGLCSNCGLVEIKSAGNGRWKCANSYYQSQSKRKSDRHSEGAKNALSFSIPKPEGCQICGRTGMLVRDHDHKTKKSRGWLCHWCNVGLGLFFDNPDYLKKAIGYLYK